MPSIKLFNAGQQHIQNTIRFFILPMTFILVFILMIIFFATTALCKDKVLIRIGVYENNPKIYTAANGSVTGFWPDLITHIANKENWNIKYVHGSWNECLQRLLENKIDIMPDVAFTEKRNKLYAFSKNPILTSWSRLYVKKHDKGIKSITDLQNKKIAVLKGSVNFEGASGIKEIVQSFNIDCTFLELDNYNKVFEAVNNTLADAGVTNRNYGNKNEKKFNLKKTAIIFQPINMKFAFPKNSSIAKHCSERIDFHMDNFLDDNNSLYYQLLEKYFETEIAHKTVEVFPLWLKTVLKSIVILLSFLILVIIISRVQVKRKTRESETKNKALRESEAHYRQLFDSLPYGGEIIDIEGKITNCSLSTSKMLGYKMDELIGKHITNFVDENTVKIFQQHFPKILKGESLFLEACMIHKNGNIINALRATQPIVNADEEVVGMLALSIDITKRKQAEKALKKSEERYRILVENANDAIFIAQDEVIKFSNRKTEELTGYSAEEMSKIPFIEIIHPDYRATVIDRHKNRLKGEESIQTYTFKIINKSGLEKTVQLNTALIQWENRPATLNFLRDISQQIKIESQLLQAQKMQSIGTLAGGIAHDFNNILFPIVGHTEMLLQDVPKDNPLRSSLEEIYTGALRARDLVKQILTFSRQESSELKLLKMQPIIREALKLLRSTIPTTIEIKQNIMDNCGIIKADPTQIHQIVMNLVTNAYHAMEDTGGKLKVNLKEIEFNKQDILSHGAEPGVYACLTVTDTGVGINKNIIEKIFDPFFTTKVQGKGTGMGLSVVYGIVKNMNGTIQVYSEPDKGTELHVYLPIAEKSAKAQGIRTQGLLLKGNEQVLLVDDEEGIVAIEKQMLERLGYQVTSFTCSNEALEAFRLNPDKYNIVITDMAMPNMSGDKLSAELIKIRPDIPILLCTGFSETMSKKKAASFGIKGFLFKPIVIKDLSQKVREVLDENFKTL